MADTTGQTQAKQKGTPSFDLEELKTTFKKVKNARERFVADWYLNLAYFLGQQWLFWNNGRLDRPILAKHRETVVDNRIAPVVQSRTSRKVKTRPAFVATPYTSDESDIDAAKICEKILDSDWDGLGLQAKLYQAIMFAEICGAGFWKVYWDSTAGESTEVIVDANGNAMTQADGRLVRADAFPGGMPQGLSKKVISQGDVCVEVKSPFEMYPDPLARSIAEAEFMFEENVRSQDYVQKVYGKKIDPDADAPVGPVESRLFNAGFGQSGSGTSAEYRGVRVFEYWAKPGPKYPTGQRVVWAADQVLLTDDHPFDPMPYVMFSGLRVPNRFWPTSVTTMLRGPQTDLNKLISQIQENAMRLGNPAILKSRQANVAYSGLPGEEVLYDSTVPDAVPSFLQPPEVPGYVREHVQRIFDSITEISGMHEVSNATVPQGVTAASAINLLQEADDTRIGPEIQDMEVGLGEAGSKVIKLRANFNSDERLIRIAGEDGNWDIFGFRGEMLGKDPNVNVQAGSAMPRSKAAKQAAMLEVLQTAFQYGLQFDPRDLRRFFKDYEVAALERLFDTISSDEQACQRENRMMAQGVAMNINEWDNDDIHIEAHNEFRKSGRFASLPAPIQTIFSTHVRAHQEKQVQQTNLQLQTQANEMAAQQAMPPTPGGAAGNMPMPGNGQPPPQMSGPPPGVLGGP